MNINDRNYIWTTKQGVRIRLFEMEDSHLLNAIAMLRRSTHPAFKDKPGPKLLVLEAEARYRGILDGANKLELAYQARENLKKLEKKELEERDFVQVNEDPFRERLRKIKL